jgi:hypothetical protein
MEKYFCAHLILHGRHQAFVPPVHLLGYIPQIEGRHEGGRVARETAIAQRPLEAVQFAVLAEWLKWEKYSNKKLKINLLKKLL